MSTQRLKNQPRLAAALQLALLLGVFQGVVATTPSLPGAPELRLGSTSAQPLGAAVAPVPLRQGGH